MILHAPVPHPASRAIMNFLRPSFRGVMGRCVDDQDRKGSGAKKEAGNVSRLLKAAQSSIEISSAFSLCAKALHGGQNNAQELSALCCSSNVRLPRALFLGREDLNM